MAHRLAGQPFSSGGAAAAATGIDAWFSHVFTWTYVGGNFTEQNNLPMRQGPRTLIRLIAAGGSSHILTGISGGVDGDILTISNESGLSQTIGGEDARSLAANRIRLVGATGSITLAINGCVSMRYVGGSINRWVPLSSATE